jgi:cell division protein FtsQ
MTRRGGLPIGPPPEEFFDLSLAPEHDDSPFLRPRVRTRVRPRRRGVASRLVVTVQAIAVGLLALTGVWLGWQQVFASDRLRIARMEVHGNLFLSEGEVRELVGPAQGENLLTLDIEALKTRLRASPWVAEAIVTRRLPDTLRIEIHERVPLALAELDGLYLMDGEGGLIEMYGPRTAGFDLPIVRGLLGVEEESRRDRARRAGELLADLAELGNEISEVFVLPSGDLRVVLRGAGETLLFGDPPYRQRLLTFLSLRRDLAERVPDAEQFDLRYRGRIYAKRPASPVPEVTPAAQVPPDWGRPLPLEPTAPSRSGDATLTAERGRVRIALAGVEDRQ